MKINSIVHKLKNFWMKSRLMPIRVFVFHQVSDVFEEHTMWRCDWTNTDVFKNNILNLGKSYTFISLEKAHSFIQKDILRLRKYAVLTADDGWASLINILPWLCDQKIPVTLFLNPAYLIGGQIREKGMDNLLTLSQVMDLTAKYSNITIAPHGWNHNNCATQDLASFEENVIMCQDYLTPMEGYVPFFAYPCGKHTQEQDNYLLSRKIIPVYCDGLKNYKNLCIHRECIDGLSL